AHDLALLASGLRRYGRDHSRDVAAGGRAGCDRRRRAQPGALPVALVPPARRDRRPRAGDGTLPQRQAAQGPDRSARADDPHRREPNLSQRPLARGVRARDGGGPPRGEASRADGLRRELDRRLGARKPRGDQSPPERCGHQVAPVRGQGPGAGPAAVLLVPRRAQRRGLPLAGRGVLKLDQEKRERRDPSTGRSLAGTRSDLVTGEGSISRPTVRYGGANWTRRDVGQARLIKREAPRYPV